MHSYIIDNFVIDDTHFYNTNFIFTSSSIILTNSGVRKVYKFWRIEPKISGFFVEIDNCSYKCLNLHYYAYVTLSFNYSGII